MDQDLVVGLRAGGWICELEAQGGGIGRVDEALSDQEAGRQLLLATGCAHRDRDIGRQLARPAGADLQRLLAGNGIEPRVDRGGPHGDRGDPPAAGVCLGHRRMFARRPRR